MQIFSMIAFILVCVVIWQQNKRIDDLEDIIKKIMGDRK